MAVVDDLIAKTPPGPREPLPTLVVKQGTLVLDDRRASPGTPVLEVGDVSFTVINDPDPTVTFEGSGASAELGSRLSLPPWLEDARAEIEATLPKIQVPTPVQA